MQIDTAERSPFNGAARPGPHDLRSIALLLDVDGTIVDMAITPGSVSVSDSLRKSLSELHKRCDGALALVSGRLIRDIDNLFAPLRLPAVGGHGAEVRPTADSAIFARTADAIGDSLRKLVIAAASVDPRVIVEDKTSSLAVHYRLAPHMEQPLKTKIAAIVARLGLRDLEILHGKAVIEIKSTGFRKGVAVRELMKIPPFQNRKPVFLGGETTDETVVLIQPPPARRGGCG